MSQTFIVDCKHCRAKVAAEETGRAESRGIDDEGEPYGFRLYVGKCPRCTSLIAGYSYQKSFEEFDSLYDEWSDVERVFPDPERTFSSYGIPPTVTASLSEGNKSLQAGATMAACVMFGRALEGVCRDKLNDPKDPRPKAIMLGKGIKELKARNIIDQRLFDWSEQLQAFRNLAAHPGEETISREDAEDLRIFVYAIIEYIYDLTDRYEDFKARVQKRAKSIRPVLKK
jgi:hypothetical protein